MFVLLFLLSISVQMLSELLRMVLEDPVYTGSERLRFPKAPAQPSLCHGSNRAQITAGPDVQIWFIEPLP